MKWKKKGGIGTGMGGNGWRSTGEGGGVPPVIVHFKGGQGYCIWNATAEDEDTMGERHNKTRNRLKGRKETREKEDKDAVHREVEWEKSRESGTKRVKEGREYTASACGWNVDRRGQIFHNEDRRY